jgi:hypothetical protein
MRTLLSVLGGTTWPIVSAADAGDCVMFLKKIALTGAGFVAGVAMTLASVSATVSPASAQMSGDQAYMMAQKAQVTLSTYQLDNAGLHALDVDANAGTLTAGALGKVRQARIAVQATEWPEALKGMASNQVSTLKALEAAIRTEDPAQVAPLAKKAHDDGHDLSAAVYGWLDTGAVPSGGHGH